MFNEKIDKLLFKVRFKLQGIDYLPDIWIKIIFGQFLNKLTVIIKGKKICLSKFQYLCIIL